MVTEEQKFVENVIERIQEEMMKVSALNIMKNLIIILLSLESRL